MVLVFNIRYFYMSNYDIFINVFQIITNTFYKITYKYSRMKNMSKQFWKPGNMLYPVPAVMVSCQREGEKPNIITVAWAGTVCTSPAMVSISVRPERYSYEIIRETKEFVINLVTKELVYATDYCGVKSGKDTDKFTKAKLSTCKMEHVKAPGINESPVCIECKVENEIKLGSHSMFLAKVVGVAVDEKYMDENGKFNLNRAGLVAYSHGEYMALGKTLGKFGYSVKKSVKGNVSAKNSRPRGCAHEDKLHTHNELCGNKGNGNKGRGKRPDSCRKK